MCSDKQIRMRVKKTVQRKDRRFKRPCIGAGKSLLQAAFFILVFLLMADFAYGHRRGLVIYSHHPNNQITKSLAGGIAAILNLHPGEVNLDVEYMDALDHSDKEHYENFYRLLKHKSEAQSKDYEFIIVSHRQALEFLLEHRAELYPDIPIVFCGFQALDEAIFKDQKSIVAVLRQTSIETTVETALKLHPSARRVVVIKNGIGSKSKVRQQVSSAIENSNKPVDVVWLQPGQMTLEELIEKLQPLGNESVVVIVSFRTKDRTKQPYQSEQYIKAITEHCKAAIYTRFEHWLGSGIVGGSISDSYTQGRKAAEIAMQILDGQSIDNISPLQISKNRHMFDYRQLKRFGISLSDLPPDSSLINEPTSFYYKYKKPILWVGIFFAGIMMVVFALTINILRRLRAEVELKKSRKFLNGIVNAIDDPIFAKDQQHRWVVLNNAACQIMGHSREELLGKNDYDIFPKEQADVFWEKDNLVFQTGETNVSEEEITWHGELRMVSTTKSVFTDSLTGEKFLTGTIRDITKHKLSEETLQKSRDELELRVEQRTADFKRANEELRTEISERRKIEQQLIEYQKQLQSLASELSLAEERLRRRIAIDVHDRIGQNLAISRIKIESLADSISSPKCNKTLNEIRDLMAQTIASTRSLTFELSPPVLYELGFEPAIEWLVRQTRQRHSLSAEFENDDQPKPLDDNIRVLLFQAVRELLVNIVKHASAKKVMVSVRRVNSEIQVEVADDGVGFDTSKLGSSDHETDGFGLFSIRERLSYISGRLDIESTPGGGTQVTLAAPIGHENKKDAGNGKITS